MPMPKNSRERTDVVFQDEPSQTRDPDFHLRGCEDHAGSCRRFCVWGVLSMPGTRTDRVPEHQLGLLKSSVRASLEALAGRCWD